MSSQSEFQKRRSEQTRQLWLGRFILVFAVVVAIVISVILFAFLPPIPIVGSVGFYVTAAILAGALQYGLRRLLGYQPQKASLRHLRSDTQDQPVFSSPTQLDNDSSTVSD